jgi:hypothetical protein
MIQKAPLPSLPIAPGTCHPESSAIGETHKNDKLYLAEDEGFPSVSTIFINVI